VRFDFFPTALKGLFVVHRKPLEDERGFLDRIFCSKEFSELTLGKSPVQINHTLTRLAGTVRGMHFQHPPHAEAKLVTCLRGVVFDVAVDLRAESPTFLHWHGEILSESNFRSFFVPEGFAHGFQTLDGDSELLYLHSAAYCAEAEGGIHPQDSRVGIRWPREITYLSPRDAAHQFTADDFRGISLADDPSAEIPSA
jgi:dTDP-4-dehydrorhamnose 3,5-epimerase